MKRFILMIFIMVIVVFINTSNVYASETNQYWNGYPQTPDLTSAYPYQVISTYGITTLVVASSPIYLSGTGVNTMLNNVSDTYMKIYKYQDGAWQLLQQQKTYAPGATAVYVEANNDIYTDSTLATIFFAKNTLPPPPTLVNGSPVWIRFIKPEVNGWKTARKIVEYKIDARIKGTINKNTILFKDANGIVITYDQLGFVTSLNKDKIINCKQKEYREIQDGDYCYISFNVTLTYANILGNQTLNIYIKNSDFNEYMEEGRTIELITFEDYDGDGKDDNTEEQVYANPNDNDNNIIPNREDYEDGALGSIDYTLDLAKYYISLPITFIVDGIKYIGQLLSDIVISVANITTPLTTFFSFLPAPITNMMSTSLVVSIVIVGIKMIRGH